MVDVMPCTAGATAVALPPLLIQLVLSLSFCPVPRLHRMAFLPLSVLTLLYYLPRSTSAQDFSLLATLLLLFCVCVCCSRIGGEKKDARIRARRLPCRTLCLRCLCIAYVVCSVWCVGADYYLRQYLPLNRNFCATRTV